MLAMLRVQRYLIQISGVGIVTELLAVPHSPVGFVPHNRT